MGDDRPSQDSEGALPSERLAAEYLFHHVMGRLERLESRVNDPESGVVVVLNGHGVRLDELERVPEKIRRELREALEKLDGDRKAWLGFWQAVVVAAISAVSAAVAAWLAASGGS